MIKQFHLSEDKKRHMIEAYIALSRVVEGHSWNETSASIKTRRIFIAAGNDSPKRLKSQFEAFKKTFAAHKRNLFILIAEAGHIIPIEQPEY